MRDELWGEVLAEAAAEAGRLVAVESGKVAELQRQLEVWQRLAREQQDQAQQSDSIMRRQREAIADLERSLSTAQARLARQACELGEQQRAVEQAYRDQAKLRAELDKAQARNAELWEEVQRRELPDVAPGVA